MIAPKNNRGIILVWYYHLPSVSTDSEVQDLVESSIDSLLSIHEQTKVPFILAITGSLLKRIDKFHKKTIYRIQKLIEKDIVEIAATCFYEVYPPILPFDYLRNHLFFDIQFKIQLFGITPLSFYPPNFTWLSIMEPMLRDMGIRNVVLDSGHYSYSCKTQIWRWSTQKNNKLNTILKDTEIDKREFNRVYCLNTEIEKSEIKIFFRNFKVIEQLCFGNTGLFHKPYSWQELDQYCSELTSNILKNEFVTIADDGDRINPVSIENYSKFLYKYNSFPFNRLIDFDKMKININDMPYLPSFSIGDHNSFWLSDLDGIHYKRLMDEVYEIEKNLQTNELIEIVMELQDVYFLFWKTISRKKYYIEKDLINSMTCN